MTEFRKPCIFGILAVLPSRMSEKRSICIIPLPTKVIKYRMKMRKKKSDT
jgi:hypothetical protein